MSATRLLGIFLLAALFSTAQARAGIRADVVIPDWVKDKPYLIHHIELMHRLYGIVIPELNWKNVPLVDALKDLAFKSRAADPTHQGIHFVVPEGMLRGKGVPVSLTVQNMPVLAVLQRLSGWYDYQVTDEDVKLVHNDWCESMGTRSFFVPTGYFKIRAGDAIPEEPGLYNVASQIRALGVSYYDVFGGLYSPDLQKLTITNGCPRLWEDVDKALYP